MWTRPWRSPAKSLMALGLLAGSIFGALCVILLVAGEAIRTPGWPVRAALAAVLLAIAAWSGLLFIHWLCCWRNFRRFLVGVACFAALIALVLVEENVRGIFSWQNHRRQCEAKGEKLDFMALLPPQVPDDRNFALAPILEDFMIPRGAPEISAEIFPQRDHDEHLVLGSVEKGTFADLERCRAFYRGNPYYPEVTGAASAPEEILRALATYDPDIKELREAASARQLCRFPIKYEAEPPWAILLPHLARLKSLTLLTHVRATAELAAGRPAEAGEDLKLGLRISDCMRDEPFLIDHLVRLATLAMDLQTIREGLARHAWSDAQLNEIQNNLGSLNILAEYKNAMRGERACNIRGLEFMRHERFRQHGMDYVGDDNGDKLRACLIAMPRGWFYQNMLTISRMFQQFTLPTVDEKAHRVFPEMSHEGEQAFQKMRTGPYTIFAKLLMPALEKAVRKSARMQAYVDDARVACALERYRLAKGQLPDKLDALVPRFIAAIPTDVIDGHPLRYEKSADGNYVLYSIGWNQVDDGGQLAWSGQKKDNSVDINQGDWVWQMPAKL
jgi:hypothetical protein